MVRIYIRKLKNGEDPHAAGRALLRELLGEKALTFGPHGKPYFAEGGVFFNISHCKGAVGIAVSTQEVGLDLEQSGRCVKGKTFAHESEKNIPPLILWVLKESFVKWSGEGISLLRGTQVTPGKENTYIGSYNGKVAILQAFEYEGLMGSIATAEMEAYEIKEM